MDILTPSSGADVERHLGRNTEATINSYDHWTALIPAAPHVFSGTAPEVSPNIAKYCPGGYDNQDIGMCVGKGTKNGAATLLRMPSIFDESGKPVPVDPDKDPNPTIQLSGLYCYWNARNVNGPSSFGEGAVVAYSLMGLQKYGVIPAEMWPDTSANQAAYNDRRPPTEVMRTEGAKHLVVYAARITSKQQYFDFLGQGYPIIDGVEIGQGWMSTAEDGRFSLGGRTVGGHCTLTVGYNRKTNQLFKRNSWAGWGAKTSDPEFQGDARGFNNIGYCALDQFEQYYLSDSRLGSGQTDAFVINVVPGFSEPLIKPISNVDFFT